MNPVLPPTPKVWLIGGTSESLHLAQQLHHHQIPVIVTVTTPTATQNYETDSELCQIAVTRFCDDDALQQWLLEHHIGGILDASHPFALEISQRAMRVAQTLDLSYLRFERSSIPSVKSAHIQELKTGFQSLSRDLIAGQNVLLTVGSQALPQFTQWHECANLYARILPTPEATKIALQAGFKRDHLIAFQPPLSFELEAALWQHWNISLVISKASGHAGGEAVKRQVSESLQIPLLILQRPPIHYQWKTESVNAAIQFGRQVTTRPLPRKSMEPSD